MQICRAIVLAAAAAALCFAATLAFAAFTFTTVKDAHEYIRSVINKGVVKGNDRQSLNVSGYRGFGCQSSIDYNSGDVKDIRWDLVTSVADIPGFTHVYGTVYVTTPHGIKVTDSDLRLWVPDDDTAESLGNAMRLLKDSCAPKAKSG